MEIRKRGSLLCRDLPGVWSLAKIETESALSPGTRKYKIPPHMQGTTRYSPAWWRRFNAPTVLQDGGEQDQGKGLDTSGVKQRQRQRQRRRRRWEEGSKARSRASLRGPKFSGGGDRFPEPRSLQTSTSSPALSSTFSSIGKQSLSTHISSQGYSLGFGRRGLLTSGGSAGPAFSGASAFGKQQLSRTRNAAAFDFSMQAGRGGGGVSHSLRNQVSPGPIYDPLYASSSRKCGIGVRFDASGGGAASADGTYGFD